MDGQLWNIVIAFKYFISKKIFATLSVGDTINQSKFGQKQHIRKKESYKKF